MYQAGGGAPQDAYCGWDDYVEAPPRVQQRLPALQPLGGIQERAVSDAQRLLGFVGGEHGPAYGE